MPNLNWGRIGDIKHAIAQERTIVCGVKARLEQLDIAETIIKLQLVDDRLREIDDQLVEIIIEAGNNNKTN